MWFYYWIDCWTRFAISCLRIQATIVDNIPCEWSFSTRDRKEKRDITRLTYGA